MIYGSQNSAVTFFSWNSGLLRGGGGSAEEGVRGQEWSEARMRAVFHRRR